jgi:hypothetical protein
MKPFKDMENPMTTYPFEVSPEEIERNPEPYVDAIFSSLESEFLVMPKGTGFIDYPIFELGYEVLKASTAGFSDLKAEKILPVIESHPISIIVLRTMLGFSPPEWAYVTTQRTSIVVSQGFIRTLDRKIRMHPDKPMKLTAFSRKRVDALLETACQMLAVGVPEVEKDQLHRLDKADTKYGTESIKNLGAIGVPYAMLLYERFLGRPFAGHRDSVSELVGDSLESGIEEILSNAGITFRKTKRAERIEGFDQIPDFIVPTEFNPQIIIEAKITEDDGTARDKVTRIQHLGELSLAGRPKDSPKYEVIACIGGRGFGVRREDMKKMILSTRGKVFTVKTLESLIDNTRLKEFRTKGH